MESTPSRVVDIRGHLCECPLTLHGEFTDDFGKGKGKGKVFPVLN